MTYTTTPQVRAAFLADWETHLISNPKHAKDAPAKREAFANFIDQLARSGDISEALAQRATLT